jgi:hydrogenase-4 component E
MIIGMYSFILMLLIMSSLYLLSSSRLGAMIRIVGTQGFILGFVPFFTGISLSNPHTWILSLLSIIVKGMVIPVLLFRALRGVALSREEQPYVGYPTSIGAGVLIVIFSYVAYRIISFHPLFSSQLIPVSITMAMCGLFLIITRKKALTQVIGYLVFENGIYLFGVSLSVKSPLLVEFGILLDVFVAVFVMGIVIYHINREFDSISTQALGTLKE